MSDITSQLTRAANLASRYGLMTLSDQFKQEASDLNTLLQQLGTPVIENPLNTVAPVPVVQEYLPVGAPVCEAPVLPHVVTTPSVLPEPNPACDAAPGPSSPDLVRISLIVESDADRDQILQLLRQYLPQLASFQSFGRVIYADTSMICAQEIESRLRQTLVSTSTDLSGETPRLTIRFKDRAIRDTCMTACATYVSSIQQYTSTSDSIVIDAPIEVINKIEELVQNGTLQDSDAGLQEDADATNVDVGTDIDVDSEVFDAEQDETPENEGSLPGDDSDGGEDSEENTLDVYDIYRKYSEPDLPYDEDTSFFEDDELDEDIEDDTIEEADEDESDEDIEEADEDESDDTIEEADEDESDEDDEKQAFIDGFEKGYEMASSGPYAHLWAH